MPTRSRNDSAEHMTRAPSRVIALVIAGAAMLLVPGCGGMSSNDMRQYAIQRRADPEDEAESPPSTSARPQTTPPAAPPAESTADERPAARQAASPAPAASTTVAEEEPASAAPPAIVAAADWVPSPADTAADAPSAAAAPPSESLNPLERAHRSVDNLRRIGQAMEAYHESQGAYPMRAIFDSSRNPMLSWRVALLPYLGQQDLYDQFKHDEPWNSRHNATLIAKIPPVYQSPERFDEKTNYLVPVAGATIFGKMRGVPAKSIEDGLDDTVLVVESDDNIAVPWTEPRDYDLELRAPTKNLGSLRNNSFYVVWGGGEVGRVQVNSSQAALRAMYTFDAGENFSAGQVDRPLFPEGLAAMGTTPGTQAPAGSASGFGSTSTAGGPTGSAAGSFSSGISSDTGLVSLAAEYLDHSAAGLVMGREREAMQWYYASAVVSPYGGSWTGDYQWVTALRRPSPTLRFGIGLEYEGPRQNEIEQAANPTARTRSSRGGVWKDITGELGAEILRVLATHVESNASGPLAGGLTPGGPDRRPGQPRQPPRQPNSILHVTHGESLSPGIYFLTVSNERVLSRAAQRELVDVLVLIRWREVSSSRGSVGIELIDVVRGETLLRLPRISSVEVQQALADPLAENPLLVVLRQLSDFLDEYLSPGPLPSQMQPRHAKGRLDMLATPASGEESPLRALAEMKLYREMQLVDDAQLLLAYQSLIGQEPGSVLMLGSADDRAAVLKEWLPMMRPDPAAPQRQARHDDDD